MTPSDPQQPPAQQHSLSPTSIDEEEEEEEDLSQMLKNSIQHQHGNSSPCTTSVHRRTGKNRTTRMKNQSKRISHRRCTLGKTPAAVPSSTEDEERLDAFRLARIILGPSKTPKLGTDSKPFLSHTAILHAIRKVAEMKIQIFQLTEQLDRYQERDKQQQLEGYKEQLFQKQQQYLFSAVSATTNTTTSTEHQDDGKEEEEELLNEKNEAKSEEAIPGIEGNYNNNRSNNDSDRKKETHNIDSSNDGPNGHDKDTDPNAAISTTSSNNKTDDVSLRRKQAIRVLQKESNWAQTQLRELESSQLQQYDDNENDNDNDNDETTNNNVANTSTPETEGQQQKQTERHKYEYRAAASVVGATNDDDATVESRSAPSFLEDDDASDNSNYKTTHQKRSNDDDVNAIDDTKHTTNNRTTATATTPTEIWRIRDNNYDIHNNYSCNSNNNNNSSDGRQNIITNHQQNEERKREMQTMMLDELYTNLYSKFETNANTNNPRSQTRENILDTTVSTTATTVAATRKPGIGNSVLQHQHPKDVAMMTLLEASLPPIDEIQQVLQRVVEFEESVLLQQQEQQRPAPEGDSTRIRRSSAVHDEVTSLLSRLLQCQLKLKKTRTMLQSEPEEKKTIIDVVDDHNLLFDNGIDVGIEYNNTTGAEIRRRRRRQQQQQQHDGGEGGDKNSIGGCDYSSIRSDTSGSDNQVEEPVTVWLNRWSDMKNRQSRSTEILQFLHLQRQLLLYDIQAMKINDDFFVNDRTIMSLSFDSLDDQNENDNDDDDDDDNYNRLRLRLEESEYQKQIGYMMKNEEKRIQEIDTLEVELTSLSFIAAQLEDDRINQFRNRTQSFVNELYSLRRNVTNFIEDETVKIFGVASSNKNKVGTTSNGDDATDKARSVGREEETPDNRIKRLEYLLTKKNIELFTTKAKLKLTEEKLRQNDNNQKHHQLESNPDGIDKFPDIIAIRSL